MDNTDEIRFWNRRGGSQWRDHQSHFDTLFSGVTERLLGYAATRPGESVMDIGCGSGDTTTRLAKAVGPAGCVTAIDVSVPLLSAAHSRIEAHRLTNVELCEADAQTMALSARADAIVSRFGVMFFSDPVAAFANLRAHTRAGGRLAVAAWGAFEDNPWFSWPFEVATDVLGPVPPRDPRSPGPTAFGDADYVLDILSAAGWQNGQVHRQSVWLQVDGSAHRAGELAADLGPVSRVYKTHPPSAEQKAQIVSRLAGRYQSGEDATGTRVQARIHFFTASHAD